MATIKHISSKNSDYSAAERYLIFQHDEYKNIPLLDAQGRMIPREAYLLDTLECGDEDFALACVQANQKFQKNSQRDEVKSHHYIISFDPRDREDNGLTMERAHQLGLEFCRKNFPGHQAIIATHPDGHNGAGNIHVHIVINSLRIREIEHEPYMEKACDWQAGMKHRCTSAHFRQLRCEVMEMCHREGLYQIDLLGGRKDRITEREYWAQRRGQQELDQKNEQLTAAGETPRTTKFETGKQILRSQIRACLAEAKTFEEFEMLLMERYGVTVKESRGRVSYIPPDRVKAVTARMLGDDFSREAVLKVLEENAAREKAEIDRVSDPVRIWIRHADFSPAVTLKIERLIDIQEMIREGRGQGYIQWARVHNLKQSASCMLYMSSHNLKSAAALDQSVAAAEDSFDKSTADLKMVERQIRENKELAEHAANYRKYRDIAGQARTARNPAQFREQHRMELTLYDAAGKYFRSHGIQRVPASSRLQEERERLVSEKNALYQQYTVEKANLQELRNVRQVLYDMLRLDVPEETERNMSTQEEEVRSDR